MAQTTWTIVDQKILDLYKNSMTFKIGDRVRQIIEVDYVTFISEGTITEIEYDIEYNKVTKKTFYRVEFDTDEYINSLKDKTIRHMGRKYWYLETSQLELVAPYSDGVDNWI